MSMWAYTLDRSAGPGLRQRPMPVPKAGEALVRVLRSGICSTDLEMIRGYKAGFEGVLGHEFVGIVERVEDEDPTPGSRPCDQPSTIGPPCTAESWVGQRVVGEININTDESAFYGLEPDDVTFDLRRNHCPKRCCLGIVAKDGTHAQYLTLPLANLFRVADSISDTQAVFSEPLAAAARILEQGLVAGKQRVAVIGDGKLGLLITRVLALHGLSPTLIGKHPAKMALLEDPDAHVRSVVLNTEGDDATAKVFSCSFDVVVDATGVSTGMSLACVIARPLGTVVLKTTCAGGAANDSLSGEGVTNAIVVKELRVAGSRCGPTSEALRLLEQAVSKAAFSAKSPTESSTNQEAKEAAFVNPEDAFTTPDRLSAKNEASAGTEPEPAQRGDLIIDRLLCAEYPLGEASKAFEHARRRGALKVQIVMPALGEEISADTLSCEPCPEPEGGAGSASG